jgi:hypothetical protein
VQGSGCAMKSRAGTPGGQNGERERERERMKERSFLDSESPTRAPMCKAELGSKS